MLPRAPFETAIEERGDEKNRGRAVGEKESIETRSSMSLGNERCAEEKDKKEETHAHNW
jgi:hypothetical protein